MTIARFLMMLASSLLAGACALTPPPAVEVVTDVGVVRASNQSIANETAEDFERLVDVLRDELVGTRDEPIEVWVQDHVSLYRGTSVSPQIGGFAHRDLDRIHVASSERPERTLYLAHEIVHLLLDDEWRPLPLAVEEGLCDYLALRATKYDGSRLVARHLAGAALGVDELRFTVHMLPAHHVRGQVGASWGQVTLTDAAQSLDHWFDRGEDVVGDNFDADASVRMRGVGYVFARRILERGGIVALHDLCVRANAAGHQRVPTDWLLTAAGYDFEAPLPETWRRWTGAAASARHVAELVDGHAEILSEQIARLVDARGVRLDDLVLRIAVSGARPRYTVQPQSLLTQAIRTKLEGRAVGSP